MVDIFDDIASDKPEDVLTLEMLDALLAKARAVQPQVATVVIRSSLWRDESLFGLRIFVSDALPAGVPRKLTRWERFRVWVEDLADRADVYYHYPRVQRTEPAEALLIGRDLYIPRAAPMEMVLAALEASA